jgi:Ca2+-binding EF-hand superfamily protein
VPRHSPSRRFQRLDTNADGYITREEARKSDSLSNHFDEVDIDHDGRISVGEMREAWRARLEARRKALPQPPAAD